MSHTNEHPFVPQAEIDRRAYQFTADRLIEVGQQVRQSGIELMRRRQFHALPGNEAHTVHVVAGDFILKLVGKILDGTLTYEFLEHLEPMVGAEGTEQ